MRRSLYYCISILFLFFTGSLSAQPVIIYSNAGKTIDISRDVSFYEDKTTSHTVADVIKSDAFRKHKQDVGNFEITGSAIWAKFTLHNATAEKLVLELPYPTIDSISLYNGLPTGLQEMASGEYDPYYGRAYEHQNYLFDLDVAKGETKTYYLRLRAEEQLQVPLQIGSQKTVLESIFNRDLIFGLYAGIILVMFFYNLFIFFTVRDVTYLYYVSYILAVGLTQACVQGYAARFFYPSSAYMANLMMVIVPVMSGVTALEFLKRFLQVKKFTPFMHKLIWVVLIVYAIVIAIGFAGQYRLAAQAVQMNAMAGSLLVLAIGIMIVRKGYRPAKFFLIAWSVFLASVIIFVLRNFGVLPYNDFTYYALQIGSSLEIILLSFALADKINIFRREKEQSQAQTLKALEDNDRIIREQNATLEVKVAERTEELQRANEDLHNAMEDLKAKEMQLVESEKMASLGQLTAGIAHEINNPINFVTSNVKPLKRDVEMILEMFAQVEQIATEDIAVADKYRKINELKEEFDFDYLKTEIDFLLKGITEGSTRTAEIVKGLRIFSRLDEDDLKKADINEGLDSTTVIINNLLDNKIIIEKQYEALPMIECYPGKLNQVFLNIITNGIHAVKSKFKETHGGVITIATHADEQHVYVSIKDNGTGMDELTKKKLFEPFFTTKDVGEGTGLGLSIAYNTIKKHNGNISINSELGLGTEFTISLPITQE